MTEGQTRARITIDLHTAMGDPRDTRGDDLPQDQETRDRLVRGDIGPGQYWHLVAYRRYLDRDFQGAVDAANLALLHEAHNAETHFLKGVCLQLLGLLKAETSPGFPETCSVGAYRLLLKAQWAFRQTLDLNPHDEEARTYLGALRVLLGQGSPDT